MLQRRFKDLTSFVMSYSKGIHKPIAEMACRRRGREQAGRLEGFPESSRRPMREPSAHRPPHHSWDGSSPPLGVGATATNSTYMLTLLLTLETVNVPPDRGTC